MKQKQSILFLTRLYHPRIGGVEKHVREISKVLKKKNFSINIVTEGANRLKNNSEMIDDMPVIRIPIASHGFFKKFYIWKWVLQNLKIFYKADIIHVHDVFYWILPFRVLFFFKKIYITFHGYEDYPIRGKWVIQRKVSEWFSNGSICVGEFMKKWYLANPTSVIYGGVRLEGKISVPKQRTAVFFGRLDKQTGVQDYVNAYKIIKKTYPEFKFTIVGEGKLKKEIPKDIDIYPFSDNVEKFIFENEFIFVSRYLSILEALRSRREVVAVYDNPLKRDYLLLSPFRKFIFVARNDEEIANYVMRSIQNGKDQGSLEAGYQWAQKQTWEKVVATYLRLWDRK